MYACRCVHTHYELLINAAFFIHPVDANKKKYLNPIFERFKKVTKKENPNKYSIPRNVGKLNSKNLISRHKTY